MPPRARLAEALVLAAILAAFWLARWPFRETFLIRDEGEYAYIGQRILAGEIPYRDVYNQKTPFAFYAMAAGQRVVGPSVGELRLFGSAYGLASTGAVYALGRAALGPLGAAVAALSFGAMVFDQAGIVHQASTEYFMLLWLALALLAWRRTGRAARPALAAAAGALAGLAFLTKQSGAALLVFFAADALWRRRRAGRAGFAAAAGDFGAALGAFAAVLALAAAWFAAHGALDEFVAGAWLDIGGYVGERHREVDLRTRLATLAGFVGRDAGFWLAGAAGLLLAARARADAASGWWLLLPVLLAAALGPGGTSRHYFLPLVVPFALGMGALAHALPRERGALRGVLALALLLPWLGPLAHGWSLLRPDPAEAPPPRLFRPFDRAAEVARAIAERTEPGERILIVGSEPEIYYLAERPAATRLIHLYTATGPYPSALALRAEFLRDLAERPRYVLLVNVVSSLTEFPSGLPVFLRPVLEVLRRDYVVDASWEGPGRDMAVLGFGQAELLLWRRRDDAPSVR